MALAACSVGCADPISYPPVDAGDAGPFTCLPNLDGQIDSTELSAAIGVPVSYVISTPGTVDLAGQVDGSGVEQWDFSQSFASDTTATISATAIDGKWYQTSFPSGQWVAPVDVNDTTEGVYSSDSEGIYLQGIASTNEAPASKKTLLVYTPPIPVYRFPLKPGSSWTATGSITGGTLQGLPYAGTDTYDISDDATGQMTLHDYTFTQVHRVRTRVTVTPSVGQAVETRQVSFVFECFGEVVRATSKPGETNDNFTMAAEVRRLTTSP